MKLGEWISLTVYLTLLLVCCIGCGVSANALQRPKGPGDVPKGQPYMMLVISGVDLTAQGLYLAPNVVPALMPPLAAAPIPTPTPQPVRPPVVANPNDSRLKQLLDAVTGGNQ